MRTLVLWDVDHTLISIRGLSAEIYATVFHNVTGRPLERLATMAGRTDRAIITETLHLHRITPTETLLAAFGDALATGFADRADEIGRRGRTLPGAREALSALAARPEVVQSVLTGNMEPIARGKLAAFGLHTLVDFEVGAFGFDDLRRPPMVGLARERASEKYGHSFDPAHTVVIGDTPHDVLAGHEGGARVVAVETGASDEAALRAAGAELVLADLRDTEAVVRSVLGASAP
ncbi:HAD family hydrolase [Actinoallomurus rhizosphaericola]|uniref:HAD family hydrolase n=1 Tax=Actinoallomurus rhizosphaericola TaxID=2952536 RepID=UPI002092D2A2|nr:haloacid dehalogenase-like hydrolase [Actinoallomurus rhizosphaericola]MCO5995018.1 haloacid dehalogenase-like hydrolase [Actinoallomurus rhizosphaericola]